MVRSWARARDSRSRNHTESRTHLRNEQDQTGSRSSHKISTVYWKISRGQVSRRLHYHRRGGQNVPGSIEEGCRESLGRSSVDREIALQVPGPYASRITPREVQILPAGVQDKSRAAVGSRLDEPNSFRGSYRPAYQDLHR